MIIDIRSGQKSGFLFCKKHSLFQNSSLKNLYILLMPDKSLPKYVWKSSDP